MMEFSIRFSPTPSQSVIVRTWTTSTDQWLPQRDAVGLHHVAFNIGTKFDELHEAKAKLNAAGIATKPVDHVVTKSLYCEDPDGNGIEVYVDASDLWRREPQRVPSALARVLRRWQRATRRTGAGEAAVT